MWSGEDIFQFGPLRTSCQRVPSLLWCLCWSRNGWGGRRFKEKIIFCGFFFINKMWILKLITWSLPSRRDRLGRSELSLSSSPVFVSQSEKPPLALSGMELRRRGARDETFDGLLGSRLCRANLCPQAYEQWPSLNLELLKEQDHTLNLLHMSRTTGVKAHAIQALHKIGTFDKNWSDWCKDYLLKNSLVGNL